MAAVEADEALASVRAARNLALHRAAEEGAVDECRALLAPNRALADGHADWDGSADVWFADDAMIGWDALHFAADAGHAPVVRLLLDHGALWNAVDELGMSAGELAWSRNYTRCYELLFEEGVRQSFLKDLLVRRAQGDAGGGRGTENAEEATAVVAAAGDELLLVSGTQNEVTYSNAAFLASPLSFSQDGRGQWRCLDQDGNMVMAEWEDGIMLASADALCADQADGFAVLNVGFGLGIIDEAIQRYRPGRHVIIEPHPDALAFMRAQGWDRRSGVEIWEGTWESFLLADDGAGGAALGDFDAVYFDTYSQDYHDLRAFFDCLPNLLAGPGARFSFFHGLAATNKFLYDVYTRTVELDLREIGLATTWRTLTPRVDEITWKGVKCRYWTLDQYYLPLAHMQLW
ncbi:type IV protein arginine methyltransferase [Malassezia sp. CBS 17886]|nr:type IV protein arginine methyltransferase [Malassezia sp. CBS 17886]